MTLRFHFGSDTNTQLFMDWLVDTERRFEFDHETLDVGVFMQYIDEALHEKVRDLGGSLVQGGPR